MENITCSVIIPSYNCLPYLKIALHSVKLQEQSGLLLETIVVDDGSSDGTHEYLEENPHLIALHSDHIGASAARNLAISQAKGEFIAFLDADDIWWHDKLFTQLQFMQNYPGVSFSFSDYLHINEAGQTLGSCFEFWGSPLKNGTAQYHVLDNAESLILAQNIVGTSCVVARKDAILKVEGFRTDLKSSEDWDLWLKLAKIGEVGVSSSCTMTYLIRRGSISSVKSKRIAAMEVIVAPFKARNEPLIKFALQQAYAHIYIAKGEEALRHKELLKACAYHALGFGKIPNKRNAIALLYSVLTLLKLKSPPS